MAYTLAQPIYHTFSSGQSNYTVRILNIDGTQTQIFTGKVDLITNDGTIDIDFLDLFSQYIDVFYEDLEFGSDSVQLLPSKNNIADYHTFIISDGIGFPSYFVRYDYNTDYVSETPQGEVNLNDPIDNRIDPRQYLMSTGYGSAEYSWSINGTIQETYQTTNPVPINFMSVNLSTKSLNTGNIVSDGFNNYTVVAPCPNRYTLYYVNKKGGLDMLLMSGKRRAESWNPDRTDVRLYADRSDRKSFEYNRIYQEIDWQYQLNTGFLTDEQARKIDNLIYSPKVFIHDLEDGTITSAIITDSPYQMKSYVTDRPISYTVNLKEAKPYKRR